MIQIPWLDNYDLRFPPIAQALDEPNGLLAVGGDLSCERLLKAYKEGIFPWYEETQPILWWSPDPRAVLFPERLRVTRSLRKSMRNKGFTVTLDTAFESVIRACADLRKHREGTWITPKMVNAFLELHERGYAHSAETWRDGDLVGGLYGLSMGRMFFGESMFSHATDASKVAFAHLAHQLQAWGFPLIDCQVPNDHLMSLGAESMERETFLRYLKQWIHVPGPSAPWRFDSPEQRLGG